MNNLAPDGGDTAPNDVHNDVQRLAMNSTVLHNDRPDFHGNPVVEEALRRRGRQVASRETGSQAVQQPNFRVRVPVFILIPSRTARLPSVQQRTTPIRQQPLAAGDVASPRDNAEIGDRQ